MSSSGRTRRLGNGDLHFTHTRIIELSKNTNYSDKPPGIQTISMGTTELSHETTNVDEKGKFVVNKKDDKESEDQSHPDEDGRLNDVSRVHLQGESHDEVGSSINTVSMSASSSTLSKVKIPTKAKDTKVKRSKSFSGCYTCRRRKIACDLKRPTCMKCKTSGFVCEGYDVKLRWSQPLEFDIYGYQLPSKPIQETEYCQRRSIEYVNYGDQAYNYYDEMDSDLATLHNMYLEFPGSKTVVKGHFGAFRGTKIKPKSNKRKNTKQAKPTTKRSKVALSTEQKKYTQSTSEGGSTNLNTSGNNSNTSLYKSITKSSNFLYPQNVSNSIVPTTNMYNHSNKNVLAGNEWLSTELLDAALLTASALNGDTHFFDMFDLDHGGNNMGSPIAASNAQPGQFQSHTNIANTEMSNTASNGRRKEHSSALQFSQVSEHQSQTNKTGNRINLGSATGPEGDNTPTNETQQLGERKVSMDMFPDSVPDQMLHLLFQGRNTADTNQNNHGFLSPAPIHSYPSSGAHSKSQPKHSKTHSKGIRNLHQSPLSNLNPQSHHTGAAHEIPEGQPSNAITSNTSTNARVHASTPSQLSPPEELNSVQSTDDVGGTPSSVDHSVATPGSALESSDTGIVPTTNQNNKFKQGDLPIIGNGIKIHASSSIKMPKNIMEILQTTPLPRSLAIDKFGIPTTSLNVNPMARYLLNYYIEDVADMMTVIPLAKNPWKFIYFPRALMAIGELASLGTTSNARNGLLNALLAVSAFNLQSKFVRGSDEMKYYVDLGIQLRRQANEFVERCMEEDILDQKYKDVLTAVLSMVTIDVVWGTMSSCKIHLDHCEKIIEKKMQHKKKLSSKAVILHRIFSSLKLIQDSTSLENIQKSEIFLNEKNYKNFLTGSKPTQDQIDALNNDSFRGIFRGSRARKSSANPTSTNQASRFMTETTHNPSPDAGMTPRANSNILDYEPHNALSPSSSFHNARSGSGTGNGKRGKYNEKITDNGKVRIEFIVNSDDENDLNHATSDKINNDADIPAFVDITRTSFQPSKNKLDDKVVSSDAIYGLPNSLILMFGEIIPLTRFRKYHQDHTIPLPPFFDELAEQLEFKLLTWKLEWILVTDDDSSTINDTTDDSKQNFISPRHEGIYHHVMSFYHALVIYFYRFIEDVNPMYLLERIEKVLYHLNKIQEILENNKETSYIIPLFWQGFIAGSEAMTLYLQNGFNKWGQDIAQTGIGTYWNARQIMLEIWRRKNHNVKNNSWVDVLRDWKTNVMLT